MDLDAGLREEAALPEPTCPTDAPDSGTCVHYVQGTVSELSGQAVGPVGVTVCGAGTCYGARTDEAGAFRVRIGAFIDLGAYRVHLDGRPAHADRFVSLDGLSGPILTLPAPVRTPRLPESGPKLVSRVPAEAQSGPLTLRIEADTELDFGFADLADEAHGQELRVAYVPPDAAAEWGDFVAVVAMAPFGTLASRPIGLHIEVPTPLTPLEPVELLVLDDDYESATLGRMVSAATGHVGADGHYVESDDGQGIRRLTWVAVRRAAKGK